MIRVIQYKVLRRQGKESLNIDGWESGVIADEEFAVSQNAAAFKAINQPPPRG
jgi:hypothetical protein